MKKLLGVFFLITLIGCTSIRIPNYIYDKYPYKRTLYVDFDKARAATLETLSEFGWTIEKESEPGLYEYERTPGDGGKQTLLFTQIRDTSFFVGSRHARLNAYLHAAGTNETELEIRYLTVTSVLFKNSLVESFSSTYNSLLCKPRRERLKSRRQAALKIMLCFLRIA